MTEQLDELTAPEDLLVPHWKIQPIIGKSPEAPFWYRLSRGIFNVNLHLRGEKELDYLEERDYFHDVFGHLPILWNRKYTDYVRGLGNFAQHMDNTPLVRKVLSNIYWFTSEFGLIHEENGLSAYGAGLLSSRSELLHATSEKDDVVVHTLEGDTLIETIEQMAYTNKYVTDGFQTEYYALDSIDQLSVILRWLWENHGPIYT